MSFPVPEAFIICALSCVAWRLRWLFVKSDISNIPGPKSASIVAGNLGQLLNLNGWDFHQRLAEEYGRVVRIFGLFQSEHLYIFDPKVMQHLVLKDQHIFEELDGFIASNHNNLGPGLVSTLGEQHRKQRKMLNPIFSTAHMRDMVPIFHEVTQKMVKALKDKVAEGPQEVDVLHWMSRAALEMIGRSGLGYSFDSLVEGAPPHPFSTATKQYIPIVSSFAISREYLLPKLVKIGTPRLRRLAVNLIPSKRIKRLRGIIEIMHRTSVEIFEIKKKALKQGGESFHEQGKDIMSILVRANSQSGEADRLSDEEVIAQVTTLTFGGSDTTSNAISRALHLISTHPEVQDKLRSEIMEAFTTYGENMLYDDLVALPFLDAVCRETLRLHPTFPLGARVARQDASVPLSTPIKGLDGREMHSIMIPKGTRVYISILNANRDPALWGPDSYEWKPERWLSPLPQAVTDARIPGIYSNLMTFFGGGRACIGFKFSQLEMKVVLSTLIYQFKFSPSKEILWKMSSVVTPGVKGSTLPQLPLNIELVSKAV